MYSKFPVIPSGTISNATLSRRPAASWPVDSVRVPYMIWYGRVYDGITDKYFRCWHIKRFWLRGNLMIDNHRLHDGVEVTTALYAESAAFIARYMRKFKARSAELKGWGSWHG